MSNTLPDGEREAHNAWYGKEYYSMCVGTRGAYRQTDHYEASEKAWQAASSRRVMGEEDKYRRALKFISRSGNLTLDQLQDYADSIISGYSHEESVAQAILKASS